MTMKGDADFDSQRLVGWKEIASFVGRDERTARRWETARGLPVRRLPGAGQGAVFAYAREITAWLDSGRDLAEAPGRGTTGTKSPITVSDSHLAATKSLPVANWFLRRENGKIAVAASILAIGAIAIYVLVTPIPSPSGPAKHHPDPVAAELYQSGQHEWQTRTPAGLARAILDLKRAVQRDPKYAEAYAALANAYNLQREFTATSAERLYPAAAAAARRAVALDPTLSSGHAALAFAEFYGFRHTAVADREFRRAAALTPGNAAVHHWYATFLMTVGEEAGAIREIESARQLDSESSAILADKALILFHAGNRVAAKRLLSQLEADQPLFASPHSYRAYIALIEGDDKTYLRELRLSAALRHDSRDAAVATAGAQGYSAGGHAGMLRAILGERLRLYAAGSDSAYNVARSFATLGDHATAIRYLSLSAKRHELDNVGLKVDSEFMGLRHDPQVQRLLAKLGLNL
jgi:Tfp pilus assembly protein PilF